MSDEASMPFEWKGVTYDLTNYDDCKIWQENGKQYCAFTNLGKVRPENMVPVDNHQQALFLQQTFHSCRPRLHQGPAGHVPTVVPVLPDPRLANR